MKIGKLKVVLPDIFGVLTLKGAGQALFPGDQIREDRVLDRLTAASAESIITILQNKRTAGTRDQNDSGTPKITLVNGSW